VPGWRALGPQARPACRPGSGARGPAGCGAAPAEPCPPRCLPTTPRAPEWPPRCAPGDGSGPGARGESISGCLTPKHNRRVSRMGFSAILSSPVQTIFTKAYAARYRRVGGTGSGHQVQAMAAQWPGQPHLILELMWMGLTRRACLERVQEPRTSAAPCIYADAKRLLLGSIFQVTGRLDCGYVKRPQRSSRPEDYPTANADGPSGSAPNLCVSHATCANGWARRWRSHHTLPPPRTLRSFRLATLWWLSNDPAPGIPFRISIAMPAAAGFLSIITTLNLINQLNSGRLLVKSRSDTRFARNPFEQRPRRALTPSGLKTFGGIWS
jgi:hypothetical protein